MTQAALLILVCVSIIFNTAYAVTSTPDVTQQNLNQEDPNVFEKLISGLDKIFVSFDQWLDEKIGFNITKAIKAVGNLIIWIIRLIIKLGKWLVENIV